MKLDLGDRVSLVGSFPPGFMEGFESILWYSLRDALGQRLVDTLGLGFRLLIQEDLKEGL